MDMFSCNDRTVVGGQDFKQFLDVCQTSANTYTPQFLFKASRQLFLQPNVQLITGHDSPYVF